MESFSRSWCFVVSFLFVCGFFPVPEFRYSPSPIISKSKWWNYLRDLNYRLN